MDNRDARQRKLRVLFAKVLSGEQRLINVQTSRLFLEAICNQAETVTCVERLISSPDGLKSVQSSLHMDVSAKFFNDTATPFLKYLQTPELATVCSGTFLRQVIRYIMDPPIFWNALIDAHKNGRLDSPGIQGFAWLLLQLISFPDVEARKFFAIARDPQVINRVMEASETVVRILGQKIKHIIKTVTRSDDNLEDGPGGRHNNDYENFREISIVPTIDELESEDPPFLRRAIEIEECPPASRLATHLDNQFRLLREDMLRDLREDLQTAFSPKPGHFKGQRIPGLSMNGVICDDRNPWSLRLKCVYDLKLLPPNGSHEQRIKFLKDHKKFLQHDKVACLSADGGVAIAIVTINRDENLLALSLPILCVRFCGHEASVIRSLLELKTAHRIELILLNTAMFAYEPVLRQLQDTKIISLKEEIVEWESSKQMRQVPSSKYPVLDKFITKLRTDYTYDISNDLRLLKKTQLDGSQARSLIAGVTQRLSLVQGAPGTGKSFTGALIAKMIFLFSKQKILVVCYTNHALDQFLEDLRKVGIADENMVRLGSPTKTAPANHPLLLSKQGGQYRFSRTDWEVINSSKIVASQWSQRFQDTFGEYQATAVAREELLDHLEFSDNHSHFYDAFQQPDESNGMTRVGRNGKAIDKYYLLDQWARGRDAGIFQGLEHLDPEIWKIEGSERKLLLQSWKTDIMRERISRLCEYGANYKKSLSDTDMLYNEKKRVIACTTTGAAKYVQEIQSASPDVLLVEEAGEILESHILTALGPGTNQLILIGDQTTPPKGPLRSQHREGGRLRSE